ncbi:hypothetical protein SDC9_144903 [bioreactor metagenome]|uniref:Uncharacterized protein n=1 Tax=bioreactor metagenome TaxID=1076179 RepID=A0A645E7Z7_9ZZZZ
MQPIVDRQFQRHQHRVPVAGVVGAKERAALGKAVHPLYGNRVKDPRNEAHQIVDKHKKAVQRLHSISSPTTCKSTARLS